MLTDHHPNWAQRLAARRLSTFVGRAAELRLFQTLLREQEPPVQALVITGPPGSGKTTLLNVFAIECENARVPHVFLDARSVTPSPQGFLLALQERLKSRDASTSSIVEALKPPSRFVIFIDNYERLYALHDWLCTTFFPGLPSNTAVVMAGRTPPPEPWITDPAWRDLVTRIHLDNFSADESRAYLDRRKVPPNWHDEIIRFSRGHPLALSLLADWCQQQPNDQAGSTLDLGAAPDVMQILVRRFVGDVADSRGRTALEACAILRVTTEAVLAKMMDISEARDEFEWLCTLSFIDYSPSGIYPHDLVREALTLDLKWRNPDKYRLLRRRALEYFAERLNRLAVEDGEALEDYVYLHRQNLVFRPFLSHPGTETILPKCERATTCDEPQMLALIERYEGEASARLLKSWLHAQPQGAWVVRDDFGNVAALMFIAILPFDGSDAIDRDPVAKELWRHLRERRMLEPGCVATVTRFVADAETYQGISPAIAAFAIAMIRHFLGIANLDVSVNLLTNPQDWEPFAVATGFFPRAHDLNFEIAGRKVGAFLQDWRQEPVERWLARLDSLEPPGELVVRSGDSPSTSRAAHDGASLSIQDVRHALKHFHVPDALASNPLVDAAFVREACPPGATVEQRVDALREIIARSVEFLGTSPRRVKLYRALRYTYLEPQGSQERTAELLDLPFSTYRGHLRASIQALTELLWNKEKDCQDNVKVADGGDSR